MAEPLNRWTPKQVHQTITLITGILLLGAGIVLICNGVGAEGSIDIKTAFLTGKIKSGSAGLFCCVFGLVLVIIGNTTAKPQSAAFKLLDQKRVIALVVGASMIIALLMIFVFFPEAHTITLVIIGIILLPFGKQLLELK